MRLKRVLYRRRKTLKENGYTYRGSNSAVFIFAFFINRNQVIKERIYSCRIYFSVLQIRHRPEVIKLYETKCSYT